jgi:hypothetical protein
MKKLELADIKKAGLALNGQRLMHYRIELSVDTKLELLIHNASLGRTKRVPRLL